MQTIDTQRIKESIDLRDLADGRTTLRRESASELAGPCPKCGGDDRFHVQRDWFFCRQCHPKHGDALELVQWLGLASDFRSACELLSAGSVPVSHLVNERKPKRAKVKRETLSNTKAQAIAKSARAALWDSPEGQPGRDYLTGRGLWPESWETFGLGYALASLPGTWNEETKQHITPKQPAIFLPWALSDGRIPAIRYRFLSAHTYTGTDGKERTEKQTAQFASDFIGRLFGGCALSGPGKVETLILCEGEINAMSVWQATAGAVDVLSLGSESVHLTEAAIRAILEYERVIVWADKPQNVMAVQQALPGAFGFGSPVENGAEIDANDWLQRGLLSELLTGLLERVNTRK